MSQSILTDLKNCLIYGDVSAGEFIYLPAGEIGVDEPLCVLETRNGQTDLSIKEAVKLIIRLSLQPVNHPLLGRKSC